jgi:hypothetical protein
MSSTISFWKQDQNWYRQQANWDSQILGSNAINSAITSALTNQSAGIASIANGKALTRVNNQLQAAATAAVQSSSGGSSGGASAAASGPAILSSSGMLPSKAVNLQSASTAQSMLASVLSGESSGGSALAGVLSGTVNIIA